MPFSVVRQLKRVFNFPAFRSMVANSIEKKIVQAWLIYWPLQVKLRALEHANEQMTAVKTVGGGFVVTRDWFVLRKKTGVKNLVISIDLAWNGDKRTGDLERRDEVDWNGASRQKNRGCHVWTPQYWMSVSCLNTALYGFAGRAVVLCSLCLGTFVR